MYSGLLEQFSKLWVVFFKTGIDWVPLWMEHIHGV
jgi:hypothetical protein